MTRSLGAAILGSIVLSSVAWGQEPAACVTPDSQAEEIEALQLWRGVSLNHAPVESWEERLCRESEEAEGGPGSIASDESGEGVPLLEEITSLILASGEISEPAPETRSESDLPQVISPRRPSGLASERRGGAPQTILLSPGSDEVSEWILDLTILEASPNRLAVSLESESNGTVMLAWTRASSEVEWSRAN